MIEIVMLLLTPVISIGVGTLCFSKLWDWTLQIEQADGGERIIRYRYIFWADLGLLAGALLLLVEGIVFGNRELRPAFTFIGLAGTLYAAFSLTTGYLCQTTLVITSTKIQVHQRRLVGLWKQQRLMYDIVRVHYRKWRTRTGIECLLLVDTRQQMNQRLMPTLDDERVAIAIKEQIITQQNLQWSSTLGKEETFISRWWNKT